MYELRIGVEKVLEQAINFYLKSANKGNKKAQYSLGCCYELGVLNKTLSKQLVGIRKQHNKD